MSFIAKYLREHNLCIEDIMEGYLHFDRKKLSDICKEALDKNSKIEFYFQSKEDRLDDKLSFRLNSL